MDPAFEQKYHAFEDNYWWFRARRDCILRLIQQRLRIPPSANILEIGCSGGPLLELLQNKGYKYLAGIDISQHAAHRCILRGLTNIHIMDATAPAFPESTFDLIIASDVLEHLEDHQRALNNWARLLKPGGQLIIFVPAFMFLWSPHDTVNRHFLRYTARNLKGKLKHAGFEVRRTSYWNTALFPPVAAVRLLKRLLPAAQNQSGDQLTPLNPTLNKFLEFLVKIENRLLAIGLRLPVGVSVMATAQRPN